MPLDYRIAVKWAKKLADHCADTLGEEHPDTLASLSKLALAYGDVGNYKKCLEISKNVYELRRETLGEEHPFTQHTVKVIAELKRAINKK